jgi:hypothetical protein
VPEREDASLQFSVDINVVILFNESFVQSLLYSWITKNKSTAQLAMKINRDKKRDRLPPPFIPRTLARNMINLKQ